MDNKDKIKRLKIDLKYYKKLSKILERHIKVLNKILNDALK